ncbi:hypothetical protein GIW81_07290 [Hyphomicrobium sp. xq]|uniref:Uncharacterized protein n=1 Tax=Hyphomicrobium album TaxID=2665159 RepID=A0A6I3KJM5_9HYPH|nr:hypothetical protein [Hyphomicrobium album]MTD94140.1 hypothetical protein [Hyphomicrobium album]
MSPVRLLCALLLAAVVLLDPGMALAGGLVDELKIGVLWHDVPGLWSGFQAEPGCADIDIEALLSPSVAFLGGTIRPALGPRVHLDHRRDERHLRRCALAVQNAVGSFPTAFKLLARRLRRASPRALVRADA